MNEQTILTTDSTLWKGQAFTIQHADQKAFEGDGLRSFFEYRHLGIAEATQGKYAAHVIRAYRDIIPKASGIHTISTSRWCTSRKAGSYSNTRAAANTRSAKGLASCSPQGSVTAKSGTPTTSN